jgi:hypothetical protein
MLLEKGQEVRLKIHPEALYGKVLNIIDEGADQDPSVVVQPKEVRCRASNLELVETAASPSDTTLEPLNSFTEIANRWAANPADHHLQGEMLELMRKLGWVKKRPFRP